jgi:hypothetical protein
MQKPTKKLKLERATVRTLSVRTNMRTGILASGDGNPMYPSTGNGSGYNPTYQPSCKYNTCCCPAVGVINEGLTANCPKMLGH